MICFFFFTCVELWKSHPHAQNTNGRAPWQERISPHRRVNRAHEHMRIPSPPRTQVLHLSAQLIHISSLFFFLSDMLISAIVGYALIGHVLLIT